MVMRVVIVAVESSLLLAEQKDPVLEQLDPPRRAAVIMALLALVLTGLFLVMTVMLGAHWVRRLARHKPRALSKDTADAAAANQRLRESLKSVLPEAKTDDTLHLGKSPKDTKVDF
jgi:predicted PurR-regulated permease PerM